LVLQKIKNLPVKQQLEFQKSYFKKIEKWIDGGGYKELQKFLDNAAEMKYNEVILTKFKIDSVYSLNSDNGKIRSFCEKNDIKYAGIFPSRGLSELTIEE